jgi:hypothetical protein
MATPSAEYPVGQPVTPPPAGVRVTRPRPAPRSAVPAPGPGTARPPINWFIVGVAGGLALIAIAGLALICAAPRRSAPPLEVATNEPDPAPIVAAAPVSPSPDAQTASVPAVPEPGPAPSAGSAPPSDVRPGPAPAEPIQESNEPAPAHFKRRDLLSADELSRQLRVMPELDLDTVEHTSTRLLTAALQKTSRFTHPVLEPLLNRVDLHGLPVAMGAECQIGKESAQNLQVLSRKLRVHLSQSVPQNGLDPRLNADVLRRKLDAESEDWQQEDALPTLMQMLQAEDRPVRVLLIDVLSKIKGRAASAALARRALFDLSPEVREAAVMALKDRPRDEYRHILLAGMRYPWAPAADHAAEALVALNDRESLPQLRALLHEPDPAGPIPHSYQEIDRDAVWTAPRKSEPLARTIVALPEGQPGARRTHLLTDPIDYPRNVRASRSDVFTVREVVRVNHLRNCLMCHAPASSPTDPVRGLVPDQSQPLPPPSSVPYYEGRNGIFVRADVTYLRQDFSVPQPVAYAGLWPVHQRYDYLVRLRYPTAEEMRRMEKTEPQAYPQREAVRWALRELRG